MFGQDNIKAVENKKLKRFCSIVQNPYPEDIRVKKQCEALISNGYCVTVICLRNNNKADYERINGVRVHRINLRKKRGSKIRYLFEYFAFFILSVIKINQLSLKKNFDIIQVSNLPDFLVFSTFIQKIRGSKIILDMHEITPEFYMSKYKKDERSLTITCLKLIEKLSLKFSDEVITVTEMIRRVFNQRSIPEKNITVIMNTIDDSIVQKRLKKNDSSFNLVYHGYLDPMYGLDIAIEGIKEFTKSNSNFKFYIFGDGPHRKYLEMLIYKYRLNRHILLMGSVPHREMMGYLNNMNLGILPIRKDVFTDMSFSTKLGEYIYLRIPVISSDLESTKYYFSEEEIMYFYSENPVDLKNRISFAYDNPQIMEDKAAKAFEKYKSIKWSVMKKKYLDLMKLLI